ncbi:uncharacterized protein LOC120009819 [Tripterygium wilfordii]|uniref:uncharacterized protein LOC120009819 n=1 Tax=Tripterygium wilfordii TaxID=458696 RepID=UPI0018F81C79|nr:uncharacterized protein LOC120009819 [Tripterygium wilfordii]
MISHLLLADDCLLFYRGNTEEAINIMETLKLFSDSSGQCLNQENVLVVLGMNRFTENSSYLGMLVLASKNRRQVFSFLKECMWSKIKGWKEKTLSQTGRGVLVKSVLQAIPTYTMTSTS